MQPGFTIGRKHSEPVPFEVACACGQWTKGIRQATHQVIACPGCGRQVFILPQSPLPAPETIEDRRSRAEDRARDKGSILNRPFSFLAPRLGPWRFPLLASAGAFALVIVAFVIIFQLSKSKDPNSADDPKSVGRHFAASKKLLGQGRFHDAVRELDEALALREKYPDALSSADRKALF